MVVIQDLDDIDDPSILDADEEEKEKPKDPPAPTVKKGFLNKENRPELYGPEGSEQGKVTEKQKQQWATDDLNREQNKKQGLGAYDSDFDKPKWFTSEWPSNCQYNNPGCNVDAMKKSAHESTLHQDVIRKSDRWQEAISNPQGEIRLSFLGMRDDDLIELVNALRSNETVEHLDVSFNHLQDTGVQHLVSALAQKALPALKELRIYKNEFTKLGKEMLKGLKFLRKDVQVLIEEPEYFRPSAPQTAGEKSAASSS
ncbi:unnamed protein product [Amoebophrya sp. A120]|nr:unnamed protein product [Amoebophrya sp. A120]|eukprot:GSA120T00005101001.1